VKERESKNGVSHLRLEELIGFLQTHTVGEAYDFLQYDYRKESERDHSPDHGAEREAFINRFDWSRFPNSRTIRRVFNQINTYYAEDWAGHNLNVSPFELLLETNLLALYRQGKSTGFRSRHIAFGVRKNLDFFDPRRQMKWLRGTAPKFIPEAINEWSRTVDLVAPHFDVALFLAMALTAIHPFTDGNGRIARITFSWLLKKWGIRVQWLAEDSDGEFLRTGTGMNSTEHFMGMFMLKLCGGFNRREYGFREEYSSSDDEQAFEAVRSYFRAVVENDTLLQNDEAFMALRTHLANNNHFRLNSPRFESLRNAFAA